MKANKNGKMSKSEIYLISFHVLRSLGEEDEEPVISGGAVGLSGTKLGIFRSNNVFKCLIENLFLEKHPERTSNSIKSLWRKSERIFHFGAVVLSLDAYPLPTECFTSQCM